MKKMQVEVNMKLLFFSKLQRKLKNKPKLEELRIVELMFLETGLTS